MVGSSPPRTPPKRRPSGAVRRARLDGGGQLNCAEAPPAPSWPSSHWPQGRYPPTARGRPKQHLARQISAVDLKGDRVLVRTEGNPRSPPKCSPPRSTNSSSTTSNSPQAGFLTSADQLVCRAAVKRPSALGPSKAGAICWSGGRNQTSLG